MMNVQGDQAPEKLEKLLKNFKYSSTKTVTEQSMRSQALLGSVMEFARRS
jgi:ribosomal protein S21